MKKIILLFGILLVLLSACGAKGSTATPVDVSALQTSVFQTVVAGVNKTATAKAPTSTPKPTPTPIPTPTNTPEPEPLVFSGNGNAVIDVNKWNGVALATAVYKGSDNFIVYNFDKDNNKLGILFNGLYDYQGTRFLDLRDGELTKRLQIQTTGDWKIEIKPLSLAKILVLPGSYQGRDDEILLIKGNSDLLKYDVSGDSNFIVYAITRSGKKSLAVNVIAPSSGSSILATDTIILDINGSGNWTIEVTSK